ncbi:hypothetical protein BCR36DRAFT_584033 [Piromyces finnis]|uniref:Uncharacterized protein n=1 Tax=Piromyces finnis TaxID=1754191 RepID=A0A1Y1V713_9FUNG|nr:hypothetical protein BCR36DRAFT_584033 [Piromyces finnis]|eukprot:ORX48916.1 hypothetical protein BCR36DRAFT_584033 [Piromyces finnis]
MNKGKLISTAINGLRSKYQTINSKATSTTANNYNTLANENSSKFTGNYLNSYTPYYSNMVHNAFNSFEGHQQRFVSTSNRGMFAQKESAMEDQWIYNKDRELLKIIKKKLAAKDAMAFASNQSQNTIPMNMAKSINFNPAFNTKGARFQVRQSPLRLSEKAELLKNSSQTFYNNPVLNSRKMKLSTNIQNMKETTTHQPQNQERLEKLKEKFFSARQP